jgi:hypothetical protein
MARSPTRSSVSLAMVSLRRPSASSRASSSTKENGLAAHAVVHLAERRDDQEGRGDAVVAQLAHHGDAVDVGQHAVDRDHGIVARGALAQGFAPRGGEIDLIAGGRQLFDELACGFRIVLDDQDAAVTSGHAKLHATIATRLSRSGAERNRLMAIATMVRYGDATTNSLRTH